MVSFVSKNAWERLVRVMTIDVVNPFDLTSSR